MAKEGVDAVLAAARRRYASGLMKPAKHQFNFYDDDGAPCGCAVGAAAKEVVDQDVAGHEHWWIACDVVQAVYGLTSNELSGIYTGFDGEPKEDYGDSYAHEHAAALAAELFKEGEALG